MKTNLVKKLALVLGITATMGATSTFVGCNTELKNDIKANLGADSKTAINRIIFVVPETNHKEHFVSFIAHYHIGNYTPSYHKDYRITYKVSKEDYSDILKLCHNNSLVNYSDLINKSEFELINNLISTYDPIDIKEYDSNSYTHIYKEEYKYLG